MSISRSKKGKGGKSNAVGNHNYWMPLCEKTSEDVVEGDKERRIDECVNDFRSISFDIARERGMTKNGGKTRKVSILLSRKHRRLLKQRRAMMEKLRRMPESDEKIWKEAEYVNFKENLREAIREQARREWIKHVGSIARDMEADPKKSWTRLMELGEWKGVKKGGGPAEIKVGDEVFTSEMEKGEAFANHYKALASDITGHSQDPDYWKGKIMGKPLPVIEELDPDFAMGELEMATRKLKNNKAPGEDGIIGEGMKELLPIPAKPGFGGGDGDSGPTRMAVAVLKLMNAIWRQRYIPESWRIATVVSILKKGDPSDLNNYRGISLMPVPLKLLLVILTTRIQEALESRKILTREQAGFREEEECAAQVVALTEMVRRRYGVGLSTYLIFVDLSKAYDTVPHEALFAKMDHIGIRGRTLDFLSRH